MNSSNAKTVAVVIILGVLGFFLYRGFASNENDTLSIEGAVMSEGVDVSTVGADIAVLLAQINSLQIDSAIFQSPVYQSLNDFTNEVTPLPQGKKNPFAPLPGSVAPAKTTKTR